MTKKQTRKVSKSVESTPVVVVTTTRNRLSSTDFNPDYTDIKSDLKKIGVLATSFIAILIILSFFLR